HAQRDLLGLGHAGELLGHRGDLHVVIPVLSGVMPRIVNREGIPGQCPPLTTAISTGAENDGRSGCTAGERASVVYYSTSE
ncbi:hypothetical protein ABID95_008038, partial [Streptomyces atratus]|uniref:hypothetical protein n=1 Tax=Streptomyces atratus TaxID=1893 RepID=UPI0033978398